MIIPYAVWGCIPELAGNCTDMTNASGTYLGIFIGAVIGGLISWLIYNRQEKTAKTQDFTLERIKELNERHDEMLKTIEHIEKHNEKTLNSILNLEKKITELVENKS
jgi:gas vesicle protein